MVEITDIEDDALTKKGWQRRSILDEPRLGEVVSMYEDMGLEVLVVDLDPELAQGCKTCIEEQTGSYKTVYTRPGKGGATDDLF